MTRRVRLIALCVCFGGCAFDGPSASDAPDAGSDDITEPRIDAGATDASELADEDGDGVPDRDDNCPGVPNPDQADDLEGDDEGGADGVGDACDPRPLRGGDSIVLFDPFEAQLSPAWTFGAGSWELTDLGLAQTDASASATVAYIDNPDSRVVIETRVLVDELAQTTGERGVGLLAHYAPAELLSAERGYVCFEDDDDLELTELSTGVRFVLSRINATPRLATGAVYTYRFDVRGDQARLVCGRTPGLAGALDISDGSQQQGALGLQTRRTAATFLHVTLYRLGGDDG